MNNVTQKEIAFIRYWMGDDKDCPFCSGIWHGAEVASFALVHSGRCAYWEWLKSND